MRLRSIDLTDYPPIGKFAIEELGNIVVIAGANGSGKTRLKEAIVNSLKGNPVMDAVVEATRPIEKESKYFGGDTVTVRKGQANNTLKNYMQSRSFGQGRYVGSVVQIDSNRSVEKVSYSQVNWLGGDPDDTDTSWNFYFSPFHNRWQDFVNYIHQKTAARGKKISDAVLNDPSRTGEDWIKNFPDPLDKYKKIFRNALPGKRLLDIDPKSPRDFRFQDEYGNKLNFNQLSSGEMEIIKVLFDVARKDIRHSIVIVDEPELHLHPTLTFQLIETLRSLGERTNQFIFLTHSSDLITTYFSTGDVYFIDPRNEGQNQAHRLLDLASGHSEVVNLIGQNIGLFAVGKKIVFVEGEDSSIDRTIYQKVAQTIDIDVRVVPAGSVANVMLLNQIESQLRAAVFGIDMYMIRDRDGLNDDQVARLEQNSRIRCLKRRHIENYFLDAEILFAVAERLYFTQRYPEINQNFIQEKLDAIASESVGFNLFKAVSETFSMSYGLAGPRVPDVLNKSVSEVKASLQSEIAKSIKELQESLHEKKVAKWLDSQQAEISRMLKDGSWKIGFNGKHIFRTFCGDVFKEDPIRVQQAYIDIALEKYRDRISELLDLFHKM